MINSFDDAKRWPLVEFCIRKLGYKVNKKHDSRRWRCLKSKSGTTIFVAIQPNDNGHYMWHSPDIGESGTILDLLLKIEGMTWHEMRDFLRKGKPKMPPKELPPLSDFSSQEQMEIVFKRIKSLPKFASRINYLTRRYISRDVIRAFNARPLYNSWEVPLYILHGEQLQIQTTIQYCFVGGDHRRFFLKGVAKKGALSVLSPDKYQTPNEIYLFENPIDALAFGELFRRAGVYISTCGSISSETIINIKTIISHSFKKTGQKPYVFLCFNNDKSGEKMSKKITEKIQKHCQEIKIILPKHKSFSEDLIIQSMLV